jgi:hypothetical protein
VRKNYYKVVFIGLSVVLFLVLARVALTATLNVGPGGYATIQAAVDAAVPGDTIHVAAGTYDENVVINKSLSLLGADNTTTIIDGNNVGNTVTITASDVTISDCRITGGWSDPVSGTGVFYPDGGVVVDGNGGSSALTGITIEDNIIDGNSGNGVYVSAAGDGGVADNIVVRNNDVYNNGGSKGYAGISLTHPNYIVRPVGVWDEWRRPKNILVQGNSICGNTQYGLYVSAGENIIIRSNIMQNNSKYGVQLAASWNRTDIPCEYTSMENNDIFDNARNGVKLTSFNRHNTITGNRIYNNGFGGTSDRYQYGFLFQDGNDNLIQDNVITANALGGLYLWGKGDPSYSWYGTTNNIIIGNTLSDHSAGYGIYIPTRYGNSNSGFLSSQINCNNIVNNLHGLKNADTTQTVDAENNWWGDSSGPSGVGSGLGDTVSNYVYYYPWSLAPSISFAIDHLNEYVSHHGTANGLSAKLRSALRAFRRGNTNAFEKILNAFIKEVESQSGKKIDPENANILIGWAVSWINDTTCILN